MNPARLPIVRISNRTCFGTTFRCQCCCGEGVGPQVNKFEQIFSDDYQASEAGGFPRSDVGGGVPSSDVQVARGRG